MANAGHSPLAYFLGNSFAMLYRITLSALHFTFVFHVLAQPLITFGELLLLVRVSLRRCAVRSQAHCVWGMRR